RVGQEFARPYVYSPLHDSRPLTAEEPLTRDLWLAPGTYTFNLRALSPEPGGGAATVVLAAGDRRGDPERVEVELGPVADEVSTVRFVVPGSAPRMVTLQASVRTGDTDEHPVRVHRWW